MATRGQTHAKRDREIAQRERRERKRAKKAAVAAQRGADDASIVDAGSSAPQAEAPPETAATEWIQ